MQLLLRLNAVLSVADLYGPELRANFSHVSLMHFLQLTCPRLQLCKGGRPLGNFPLQLLDVEGLCAN